MPELSKLSTRSNTLPYLALAFVAFVLLTLYAFNAYRFVEFMQHGQYWSRIPFAMDSSDQVIDSLEPEAQSAHLQKGDRVVSLDGQAYTNSEQLADVMQSHLPGSYLRVGILHPDKTRVNVSIPLTALRKGKPGVGIWAAVGFLRLVFPFLCLALGFWVVLAKPRDKNAWFLLGIFAYFDILFQSPGPSAIHWFWVRWIVDFGTLTFLFLAFPCIMLFGLYFPDRSQMDRRAPWLKWSLLIPLAILLFLNFLVVYDQRVDFVHWHLLGHWVDWLEYATDVLCGACVFMFFGQIHHRLKNSQTADSRRRIHVLYTGSAVGLGGLLVLGVLAFVHSGQIEEFLPLWLVFVVATIPLLFPVTLAYVVVVQRAMDIRILLRQGTKYAFARSTLWILQFIFVAAVTYRLARVLHEPRVSRNDIFILLVLGLIVLAMRYRVARAISTWLDRKFFREAYSAEQVMSDLAIQVRSFTETRPLLETVTQQISSTLHIEQIAVLLNHGGSYQLQQSIGIAPSSALLLPENSSAIRHLLRSRAPATLYNKDQNGWLMQASESERNALQQLSAELLLPLPGRKEMVGVMALGPKLSEESYSHADLQLLQSLAAQTGLAIENTELMARLGKEAAQRERLSREIEIAREVQERLFPQTLPDLPDGSCAGHCRPAQGVGGDYYDFIPLTNGRIGIAVGDVSGKGISAALVMASLRASLHGITLSGSHETSLDLATVIQNISKLVHNSSTASRYATFFFGEYDPHTHLFRYVNAGHNPPVVVRPKPSSPESCRVADCEILRLDVGGTVVGLVEDPKYSVGTIRLQPSDVLVAFTDGISEAMNDAEEEWGEDRMIEMICKCCRQPAEKIVEQIFSAADAFTQGAPQHDDMTLTVLARHRA